MKLIDLSVQEERITTFYKIVALISLIVFLVVGSYGIYGYFYQNEVVGLSLVTVEIPIKPVTMFFLASITGFYSTLQISKPVLKKFSKFQINLTKFVAFIVFAISVYEVLFIFTFWGANISAQAVLGQLNPDLIVIEPPTKPQTPWSVLFATKIWVMITIVSAYYLYFIAKFERERKSR